MSMWRKFFEEKYARSEEIWSKSFNFFEEALQEFCKNIFKSLRFMKDFKIKSYILWIRKRRIKVPFYFKFFEKKTQNTIQKLFIEQPPFDHWTLQVQSIANFFNTYTTIKVSLSLIKLLSISPPTLEAN